jgi:hypothetical protein
VALQADYDQFILDNISRNYGGSPEGDVWGGLGMWDFLNPFEGIFDTWGIFRNVIEEDFIRPVPVVISEVPQTWEELEEEMPELFEPILETRPGRTPDSYPQTDIGTVVVGDPGAETTTASQEDLGDEEVAHDWGHIAREFLGGVINPTPAPVAGATSWTQGMAATTIDYTQPTITSNVSNGGDCDGMTWGGGAPPKGYKVVRDSCGNGVLRKVRRRRRRRMLTSGDKDDIASIVSMVGKGQMAAALINGSMRRG